MGKSIIKTVQQGVFMIAIFMFGVAATVNTDHGKSFEIAKNIEIFVTLYKELNTYYVDDIDPARLMRTGVDAMLESLDPYTNYISESDIEGYRYITEGKYNGIGANFEKIKDYVAVLEPYEGTPAHKAGLKAGDRIIAVDGKSAKGKSVEDVGFILRGAPGTEVELTISRPGTTKELKIIITRDEVQEENVPYHGMLKNDVGYIVLTIFTRDAGAHIAEAYRDLKSKNPNMKGLILDLRGNGGGLLAEAVNICNIFIPKGQVVVTTKGKVVEWDRSFKTMNNPEDEQIPVVVLIDKGSASASEIVSGTLQDYDRAVLMGQRSYGKGLVQNTREVGYNAKIKLTTAKYYIPSGRCIQAISYHQGEPMDVPDSQRAQFKTTNGRIVLDGGGVTPDLLLPKDAEPAIIKGLRTQFLIFDYVTDYVLKHPTIDSVADFHFKEFDGFAQFLSDKGFVYDTESEIAMKKLKEQAEKEKFSSLVAAEIKAMETKIQNEKKGDLARHKEAITKLIEREIVGRYYYQKGKFQINLRDDSEVEEAIKLLNDPVKYRGLLKKV
jgi:carboxyl-terminal processing protease